VQYPERFVLEGSERHLAEGHVRVGDVDADERVTVTVDVRPPPQSEDGEADPARSGTAPEDLEAVREFAAEFHLSVEGADPARHRVALSGRLDDLERAFGTSLGVYVDETGRRYRGWTGPLEPPLALEAVVTAVFGLDEGP
jgi:hypothetical protein